MKNFDTHDYLLDLRFEKTPLSVNGVELYQIGKRICRPDTVVPPHFHIDWFEYTVVLGGKGSIYTNSETEGTPVTEGDVYLSFPSEIHTIKSDPEDPLKYAFFSFRLTQSPFAREFAEIAHACYDPSKRLLRTKSIPTLIEILLDELTEARQGRDAVLSDALDLLLTFTARATLTPTPTKSTLPIGKNELLCYKVMQYIDRNIMHIRTLCEVAVELHYNYSYLCRIFHKTTGRTLSVYLSEQKIERAKLLITEGMHSLTEIAELLGYASLFSFSKSFRYHVGCSPSAFKKCSR